MGSGASKRRINELEKMLNNKNVEIEQLKCQFSNSDSYLISPEKSESLSLPSFTNLDKSKSSVVKNENYKTVKTYIKKKRRLEVSAEVMKNEQINYDEVNYEKSDEEKQLIRNIMTNNLLFSDLGHEEFAACIGAFFKIKKSKDSIVIQQGEQGDNFYAIAKGNLDIFIKVKGLSDVKYGELNKGQGFGELALLFNAPRAATIKSTTDCILWAIERKHYRAICSYHEIKRQEEALSILKEVPILKQLTNKELNRAAISMDLCEYKENTIIVREGEVGEDFYIIASGVVAVSKSEEGNVSELKRGDYFGEKALLNDEVRSATCTAKTSVKCMQMDREHFIAIFGSIQELTNRDEKFVNNMNTAKKNDTTIGEKFLNKDIRKEDLKILNTLGCGAFGRVKLVQHVQSKATFALKCMSKQLICDNNLEDHVQSERNVMLMLDHPFILKLYNSFQDKLQVYLLIELALGGELFTHLKRRNLFEECDARFYIASVILAFEHIHEKNLVYRDLKPENLVLDADGYLKMIDFGLAKICNDRTFTLCGTTDYLSPEIILNKGHDRSADYWALGILIYELICGQVPFMAEDPLQVYRQVLNGVVAYPSNFSKAVIDLITKLLTQNPKRRLGNLKNGIKDIMKHRWFSGFDWSGLINKKIKPPIQPEVKNNLDASNFDFYQDDEYGEEDITESNWDPDF